MTNIAKRALGLASALVFMGAMALAASPVQAADVDTRIAALERELAQLKQNQEVAEEERALAAEMKGPKFSYKAGKGLTISAADNNWSIKFGQRLQVFSTYYMTHDNPKEGYQNGQLRVRRFRPSINVTSQQGFYAVNWTFNGKSTVAFDGDGYLNFNKINPFLPSLGWGYNPSFSGISKSLFSSEDAIFSDALAMGGAQDGSVVLSWKSLPAMGLVKISHLNFAVGHDEMDEYGNSQPVKDNSRSYAGSIGIKPMGGVKSMGGLDLSSFTYKFAYESLTNGYPEGVGTLETVHRTKSVGLASIGTVTGDHKYVGHSLDWSPVKFLNLTGHYVSWRGDADKGTAELDYAAGGDYAVNAESGKITGSDYTRETSASAAALHDRSVNEIGFGVRMWMWGPKSGALGGSSSEGGISIAPVYTVVDIKKHGTMTVTADGMTPPDTGDNTGTPDVHVRKKGGDVTNTSLIIDFYVPGGWLKLSGIWDNYKCDMTVCHSDLMKVTKSTDNKRDSFNTFTLAAEYRF